MSHRPELPTTFRHGHAAYNVLPDVEEMTWGVWDLDGWIGEIHRNGDWSFAVQSGDPHGHFPSWQEAVVGLLHDGSAAEQ